jgi:hypothetical protein
MVGEGRRRRRCRQCGCEKIENYFWSNLSSMSPQTQRSRYSILKKAAEGQSNHDTPVTRCDQIAGNSFFCGGE